MGCSELWGEYLNKGSQEQKAIRDTSEAQLMCVLFDVASYINRTCTTVEAQTHIAVYRPKMHGYAHSQLHIIDALFVVLSALISCCFVAGSCLSSC